MLSKVSAERFVKAVSSGRTKPCLIECTNDDGELVEIYVKSSTACNEQVKSLGIEAIAAMLAADLSLPVPEPFIVELSVDFLDSLTNHEIKEHLSNGCSLAFGSKSLGAGWAAWVSGQTIPKEMGQDAIEVYIFDAILINTDRRPKNPNCLTSGSEVAIFDHELSFYTLLFWKEPWHEESDFPGRDLHIFAGPYFDELPTDLTRFIDAWNAISDDRFNAYLNALPSEWLEPHRKFFTEKIEYLKNARRNINQICDNALRRMR